MVNEAPAAAKISPPPLSSLANDAAERFEAALPRESASPARRAAGILEAGMDAEALRGACNDGVWRGANTNEGSDEIMSPTEPPMIGLDGNATAAGAHQDASERRTVMRGDEVSRSALSRLVGMQKAAGTQKSLFSSASLPNWPSGACGRNDDDGDDTFRLPTLDDDDMMSLASRAAAVNETVSARKEASEGGAPAARSLPARKCAHWSRIAGGHRKSAGAVTMVVAESSPAMHVQRIAAAVQGKHRRLSQCGHDMVNCRKNRHNERPSRKIRLSMRIDRVL